MRLLVTGGAGFLGSAFAALARAGGHTVVTVDRQGSADHLCDIGDETAARPIVAAARPDCIVHLAAALTDAAVADVVTATRVNALGTAALFAAAVAHGVPRVVYASSVAAVGPCPDGSGDGVALDPRTIYGATKAFGEHLARAMDAAGSTRFVALRFGWVYGPGRARGWRVAQDMIERFAAGEREVPFADIKEPMDWTYVDDAADILLRAAGMHLAAFTALNVVGDRRVIGDAARYLEARFRGARAVPIPSETPASGWGIRNDRLAEVLGVVPSTRLEDGIARMLGRSD